jgi:predicted Zn-dependent peptidase
MRIPFRVSTLANGLRVVTVPAPGVDSVCLSVWVPAGSRYEPARLAGASHFIEHLLFKGTRRRSARELSAAVEGRGGSLDAFTQEEVTGFVARVIARHSASALYVMADMLQHARFLSSDVEKEREVIREEIALYRDQPQQHVEDLLMRALWRDHPIGHPLTGTEESLAGLTRENLLGFKRRHYRAGGMVVGASGAVDHGDFVREASRALKTLPAGRPPAWLPAPRRPACRPMTAETRAIDQVHAMIGFRAFGRRDPRRYALRLLGVLLGGNMSSRLFQTVRERHGLAYSIGSGSQQFADTGLFSIDAGLDVDRAARALALIGREVNRLRREPAAAAELTRARDYTLGQMLLALESPASQLGWVGEQLFFSGRVVQPDEIVGRLERVTRHDVRDVARDIFRADRMSVSMVLPEGADAALLFREFRLGLG